MKRGRREEEEQNKYLHVMEDGIAKRDKVAVGRVEDIEIAPAIRPLKGGASGVVVLWKVGGDEGIRETHDRRRIGGGGGGDEGGGGAIESGGGWIGGGEVVWRGVVGVKDAESNTGVGEIAANGELEGGETVIGEEVCAGDDGKNVNAGGETADGGDVGGRKGGAEWQGVDGVWVEKVDTAVFFVGEDGDEKERGTDRWT